MDRLIRLMVGDFARITICDTKELVEDARKIHETSATASAAFGRTLTATAMIGAWLKNPKDSVSVNINGDGILGRIITTAKNDCLIKGYVANPKADLPARKSDGKLDVAKIVGSGDMSVVMDLGLKEPYVGRTELISGEIGLDFANYFLQSEQVPSAVGLGVLVDVDLTIKAAGGFIVQLLPGAKEEDIKKFEKNVAKIDSVTNFLIREDGLKELEETLTEGFNYKFLDEKSPEYRCDCSRKKVSESLESLNPKELIKIINEDEKAEVSCYFCNSIYHFDKNDLEDILKNAINLNS